MMCRSILAFSKKAKALLIRRDAIGKVLDEI
jgi:hypothetical protein